MTEQGMADPLLIVDVQGGFLNDFTRHIPDRIARLIDTRDFDPVLFTRFVNVADSPYQRLLDWHACFSEPETRLAPAIQRFATGDNVHTKYGLAGLPRTLAAHLRERGINRIAVAGIDTDMCVLKTAMDLFDLGIEPIILTDCCASTAGLQAHFAGLAILSRNVGPLQLRATGLGGELHAAPTRSADPVGGSAPGSETSR
jgi:nicotinamidase-related amidase